MEVFAFCTVFFLKIFKLEKEKENYNDGAKTKESRKTW